MRVISIGFGKVKITPAMYDGVQSLLFQPGTEAREIGSLTGDGPGEVFPRDEDTLIMFKNIEGARVLLKQVLLCVEQMEKRTSPKEV